MAALGDERLFEAARERRRGDRARRRDGVRRRAPSPRWSSGPAWAKVAVVIADEREQDAAERPDHAQPRALAGARARGRGRLRDAAPRRGGRLRPAGGVRIGVAVGVTPPERAARIEGLLDAPRARASSRSPTRSRRCSSHLATDKKHAGGRLRWVLPTADGVVVRDDVPDELVAPRPPAPPAHGRVPRHDRRPRPPGPEPEPPRDARAGDLRYETLDQIHAGIAAARRRARPRRRLLPVEPRGRPHRPAARARLRRRRSSTRAA